MTFKPQQGSDAVDSLRFLGVGSGGSSGLGAAAAVLEQGGRPVLLIDCGPGTPQAFRTRYGRLPAAVFITHVHLDHVAGLETLFAPVVLTDQDPVRLYAPAAIVPDLHRRLGDLSCALAEGGRNFWDAFQLIPVERGFWHENTWFDVFEARHHAPGFAWGLRLAGRFLYSGDTRPIPEVINALARTGERLFHDCALAGNPSHSGWDDLQREYPADVLDRLVAYHYESTTAGEALERQGATVASTDVRYSLGPVRRDAGANSGDGLKLVG